MQKISLIGISVVVLVLVGLIFNGVYASKPAQTPTHTTIVHTTAPVAPKPPTKEELLALVNAERAKNNVAPLVEDPRLDVSAQRKADDEVTYNYFGHISPHDGKHGYAYINDVNIYCKTDAENLTDNTIVNDAAHAMKAWTTSPTHHAAVIDSDYSLTGFGINGTEIVEHFCQQ